MVYGLTGEGNIMVYGLPREGNHYGLWFDWGR